MSANDREQLRPFHAKPAAGQEAADAVAAVLQHAAERDQAVRKKKPPRKQPKWMLPLGLNLAVFAVYLLIAPPRWVTLNPIPEMDVAQQEEGLRLAMLLQARRIEAFRLENGRLPETLEELQASTVEGVDYVRTGSTFQLIAMVDGTPIVYDSAGSDEEFVGTLAGRLTGG